MAETNSSHISFTSTTPQSLKIVWKIPDYFSLPDNSKEYSLDSPQFIFANAKWRIQFYPNRTTGTDYSLVRLSSLVPCHKIIFIFGIAKKEAYCYGQYDKLTFERNEEKESSAWLPTRSELFSEKEKLAADGNLTLMWHLLSEESGAAFTQNLSFRMDSGKILCQNLKNLLLDGHDYDLTLKVKDKEFRVHRNILRARSQVFDSMLTHDMMEKNSGVVDIPDCDPQAMKQFLLYIYCGKVDELNEVNMLGLYHAADKYNMLCLKEECRNFIRNSLSCSNICVIVLFASKYSDSKLLKYATEFFINNTHEIVTTTEWMSFLKENEVVANELFIKASSSKKWMDSKTDVSESIVKPKSKN